MVPPSGRTIRNVPISNSRKEPVPAKGKEREIPIRINKEVPPTPPPRRPRQTSGKMWWYIGGGVLGLVVIFALLSLMSGARIEVIPKMARATSSEFFPALKTEEGASLPTSALPFQIVTVTKSAGKAVKANGEEQVERKASGTIVIYNDFGTASQRLIKNTRFESPEGLIYRINESVVVPGQKVVSGQTVPGSVEALVYADEPGERYNIGLTDFTIPGFKGDVRYSKMYARSKIAMAGGFIGAVKKVADEDMARVREEIQVVLKEDLLEQVRGQIPETMVVLNGLEKTVFTVGPQSEPTGNSVKVNVDGSMTVVIVPRDVLANFLSPQVTSFGTIPVTIANVDALTFFLEEDSVFDAARDTTFQFGVREEMVFVGQTSEEEIIAGLAGKPKAALPTLQETFPAIERMKVSVIPPWSSRLPEDAKGFSISYIDPTKE